MSKEHAKQAILDQINQLRMVAEAYAELVEEGKIPAGLHKKSEPIDWKELRSQINELPRYTNHTKGLLSLEVETVSYRKVLEILNEFNDND